MEKMLKGVCAGAGYFSRYHLDGWNRIPEVQITALCDPNQKRAEDRMLEFGIARRYSDCRDYLKTLDIVAACYRSAETGNPEYI
jgi:predicted dehydrogenase